MQSNNNKMLSLTVAAMGVVYGDIGTSPLYALRQSLFGLPITSENVLGVLSLIFWSLIIIISIKYLLFVLRADNKGEGGVLALLALLSKNQKRSHRYVFWLSILGGGLLLGDGMITPAISVVSAIEGLKVISPTFSHLVIPLTVFILLVLYMMQHHGTDKIGHFFGPIIILWFVVIGMLGLFRILQNPTILSAMNPYFGFQFFQYNRWLGYSLLGGIFLVVTGGEALYTAMGHFGKTPIRLGWFFFVLPALLMNYFGQGAYLLLYPNAIINPFYALAPQWFAFPLLILATVATIIASQAVITAIFSMTKQAILLDLCPRLMVTQTSEEQEGQIYISRMNITLALGSLLLVLVFKNSDNLAHVYGLAVNAEMLVTTILIMLVAIHIWKWSWWKIIPIFLFFISIDVTFLGSNAQKIVTGGWVTILIASVTGFMMTTWHKGLQFLRSYYENERTALVEIIGDFKENNIDIQSGRTIIFVTDPYDNSGGGFLHYLKLNRVMPEHTIILSVSVENRPYVSGKNRYEITSITKNIYRLILHYGFMQTIDVPHALTLGNVLKAFPFSIDVDHATYLIEISNVTATKRKRTLFFFWQEKFFSFLARNVTCDIEFYCLPYNRTIAIGTYCEI